MVVRRRTNSGPGARRILVASPKSPRSPPTRRSSPGPPPSAVLPPVDATGDSASSPEPADRKRRKVTRSPVSVTPDGTASSAIDGSTMPTRFDGSNDANSDESFIDLQVPPCELRPSATLTTGQCFHWKALSPVAAGETAATPTSAWGTHDATEWIGTLRSNGRSVVVRLRETPESTLYQVLHPPPASHREPDVDVRSMLRSYFQLAVPLSPLYERWSGACPRLARIANCIPGVRVVDQDPWECLVSFICSSNNNIPRITKMLGAIRAAYGDPLVAHRGQTLYSFPSLDAMGRRASEQELRDRCGLGYRAKYVMETIRILGDLGGEEFLHRLRSLHDPAQVQAELLQLRGVGRKVADCVALFSLRQTSAIPVDVHVWQIARRDYNNLDEDSAGAEQRLPDNVKSLTPKVYEQVGNLFRERFGSYSGWAHSLLFVAELPSFRPALPTDMVDEMERFRTEEKEKKAK